MGKDSSGITSSVGNEKAASPTLTGAAIGALRFSAGYLLKSVWLRGCTTFSVRRCKCGFTPELTEVIGLTFRAKFYCATVAATAIGLRADRQLEAIARFSEYRSRRYPLYIVTVGWLERPSVQSKTPRACVPISSIGAPYRKHTGELQSRSIGIPECPNDRDE